MEQQEAKPEQRGQRKDTEQFENILKERKGGLCSSGKKWSFPDIAVAARSSTAATSTTAAALKTAATSCTSSLPSHAPEGNVPTTAGRSQSPRTVTVVSPSPSSCPRTSAVHGARAGVINAEPSSGVSAPLASAAVESPSGCTVSSSPSTTMSAHSGRKGRFPLHSVSSSVVDQRLLFLAREVVNVDAVRRRRALKKIEQFFRPLPSSAVPVFPLPFLRSWSSHSSCASQPLNADTLSSTSAAPAASSSTAASANAACDAVSLESASSAVKATSRSVGAAVPGKRRRPLLSLRQFERVWLMLFYAAWLSDKPLVQRELFVRLALLQRLLHAPEEKRRFFKAFFLVLQRQWHALDQHRLDKFMLLIRIITAELTTVLYEVCSSYSRSVVSSPTPPSAKRSESTSSSCSCTTNCTSSSLMSNGEEQRQMHKNIGKNKKKKGSASLLLDAPPTAEIHVVGDASSITRMLKRMFLCPMAKFLAKEVLTGSHGQHGAARGLRMQFVECFLAELRASVAASCRTAAGGAGPLSTTATAICCDGASAGAVTPAAPPQRGAWVAKDVTTTQKRAAEAEEQQQEAQGHQDAEEKTKEGKQQQQQNDNIEKAPPQQEQTRAFESGRPADIILLRYILFPFLYAACYCTDSVFLGAIHQQVLRELEPRDVDFRMLVVTLFSLASVSNLRAENRRLLYATINTLEKKFSRYRQRQDQQQQQEQRAAPGGEPYYRTATALPSKPLLKQTPSSVAGVQQVVAAVVSLRDSSSSSNEGITRSSSAGSGGTGSGRSSDSRGIGRSTCSQLFYERKNEVASCSDTPLVVHGKKKVRAWQNHEKAEEATQEAPAEYCSNTEITPTAKKTDPVVVFNSAHLVGEADHSTGGIRKRKRKMSSLESNVWYAGSGIGRSSLLEATGQQQQQQQEKGLQLQKQQQEQPQEHVQSLQKSQQLSQRLLQQRNEETVLYEPLRKKMRMNYCEEDYSPTAAAVTDAYKDQQTSPASPTGNRKITSFVGLLENKEKMPLATSPSARRLRVAPDSTSASPTASTAAAMKIRAAAPATDDAALASLTANKRPLSSSVTPLSERRSNISEALSKAHLSGKAVEEEKAAAAAASDSCPVTSVSNQESRYAKKGPLRQEHSFEIETQQQTGKPPAAEQQLLPEQQQQRQQQEPLHREKDQRQQQRQQQQQHDTALQRNQQFPSMQQQEQQQQSSVQQKQQSQKQPNPQEKQQQERQQPQQQPLQRPQGKQQAAPGVTGIQALKSEQTTAGSNESQSMDTASAAVLLGGGLPLRVTPKDVDASVLSPKNKKEGNAANEASAAVATKEIASGRRRVHILQMCRAGSSERSSISSGNDSSSPGSSFSRQSSCVSAKSKKGTARRRVCFDLKRNRVAAFHWLQPPSAVSPAASSKETQAATSNPRSMSGMTNERQSHQGAAAADVGRFIPHNGAPVVSARDETSAVYNGGAGCTRNGSPAAAKKVCNTTGIQHIVATQVTKTARAEAADFDAVGTKRIFNGEGETSGVFASSPPLAHTARREDDIVATLNSGAPVVVPGESGSVPAPLASGVVGGQGVAACRENSGTKEDGPAPRGAAAPRVLKSILKKRQQKFAAAPPASSNTENSEHRASCVDSRDDRVKIKPLGTELVCSKRFTVRRRKFPRCSSRNGPVLALPDGRLDDGGPAATVPAVPSTAQVPPVITGDA